MTEVRKNQAAGFEALVLAAGAGARFGGGKLMAAWKGGVLLDGALSAAFAAPVPRVSVVWGADPRVAEAATAFARRTGQSARLKLVHCALHTEGLSRSLAAGVANLAKDCEGVFVFLGDMPRTPLGLPAAMIEALSPGMDAVAPSFCGQRGHPVLFSQSLFAELGGMTGDRGAGALLDALGDRLGRIDVADDGVLYDVDRPEDLAGPSPLKP